MDTKEDRVYGLSDEDDFDLDEWDDYEEEDDAEYEWEDYEDDEMNYGGRQKISRRGSVREMRDDFVEWSRYSDHDRW